MINAEARVTELEGLLREAREDLGAYLDADYPEGSRAKYPEIRRRWNRDMDLCRRIDAALSAEHARARHKAPRGKARDIEQGSLL